MRAPGPVDFLMDGHFIGMFAQDRWKLNNNLTINYGARYDIEVLPTPNQENPLFADDPDGYPMDLNNIAPRLGFAWSLDEQGRSAMRGGFGVFYQRTAYAFLTNMFSNGRFSDSFTVNFPTNNFDPGSATGQPADRSVPGQRPGRQPGPARRDVPAGHARAQWRHGALRQPRSHQPFSRTYSIGYERQVGSTMGISVDFIRSEQRNQSMLMELNPLVRQGTLATNPSTRTNPLVGTVGEWAASVTTLEPVGEINYNSVQVSGTKRYGNNWQARISYAYSRGRGNMPTGQTDVPESQFLGDLNLDKEYGPTAVDRPHILTLTGSYDVPRTGGLKLSAVFRARSGTPISLRNTTFDHDSNGLTEQRVPGGQAPTPARRLMRRRRIRFHTRWSTTAGAPAAAALAICRRICAPGIASRSAVAAHSTRSSTSSTCRIAPTSRTRRSISVYRPRSCVCSTSATRGRRERRRSTFGSGSRKTAIGDQGSG